MMDGVAPPGPKPHKCGDSGNQKTELQVSLTRHGPGPRGVLVGLTSAKEY